MTRRQRGPIQVVKVVALLAMTILDRQDEHKEESINCCRDFPCNSRNPFPYLNAVSSPLRLTRYLKHLACREVSLSRASRAHTMTQSGPHLGRHDSVAVALLSICLKVRTIYCLCTKGCLLYTKGFLCPYYLPVVSLPMPGYLPASDFAYLY